MAFFFRTTVLYGQSYPIIHYTFEDGLPSNIVYEIYKDSKGFLWMATNNGIARYNGIKFELFSIFDGLPDNEIYFFREDNYGRLWMGTQNGRLCYYKNDTFHTAANTPFLKLQLELQHIGAISAEYDSSLTFSFYTPRYRINIKNEKVSVIDLYKLDVDHENFLVSIKKYDEDKYIMYGQYNTVHFDTSYHIISVKPSMFTPYIRHSYIGDQEYLFDKKFLYDKQMNFIMPLPGNIIEKGFIHNFSHINKKLFTCTSNGLFVGDSICVLKDDVSSVTTDTIGNYWISTLKSGIFCLRNDFLKTRIYDNMYSGSIFYCKSQGKNVFYTTAENDLYRFQNGIAKKIFDYQQHIRSTTKSNLYKQATDGACFIDSNYKYYSIYEDKYITLDNVLSSSPVPRTYINQLFYVTGPKRIIAKGADLYIKGRESVRVLSSDKFGKADYRLITDSLDRTRIQGFAADTDKRVWFSNVKSVYKIHEGKAIHQPQFDSIKLKTFDFLGDYLIGYTYYDNKLLLISNYNDELQVDSMKKFENCAWNTLYKLNDSMMLISTNNLYRLLTIHRTGKEKYTLSVIEDRFVPLNIEAFCSDDSCCYFFKNGAMIVMSINSLVKKNQPPKLFFSLLKTAKRTYHIDSLMELPYNESRNLTISFSTQSFAGKNVFYQYSISKTGHDVWRSVTSEELNLIHIGYGDYLVKVRAKTIGSDYSEPIFLSLHILRPYWATWWFIILCSIVAFGIAGLVARLRILYVVRNNKRKHEQEMKFVKSEFKAMNALMNPHFIFNTLNNVQSLFNANDKLAANEYLRIFADLIRQNMHNVSKELIPLQREIVLVMNYLMLEKLRFEDKLNYVINIDDSIDPSEFMIPPLLIQPLVENSIKHGILQMKERGGTIIINVSEANDLLCVEVKDDGVGLSYKDNDSGVMHESFGMENIKKRIEQLSLIQGRQFTLTMEEINDSDGNHLWTVVTICMPIS